MKKSLLILAACLLAAPVFGQNFTVTPGGKRAPQPTAAPAAIRPANGRGSVQWALRLGNPFHAINLFAPKEYGDGTEFIDLYPEYNSTQHTPIDKPRGHGVRLFSFTF